MYWNGTGIKVVTPEVVAVMPSFYADFTGKLLPFGLTSTFNWPNAPQNATQLLGEYGVQAFTLDKPYTVHVTAGAPAVVSNSAISGMWNELFSPPSWQTVSPPLMPAGSTLPGAGVAAVGWANHMEVFTTLAGGFLEGLWQQKFEQNQGWLASPNIWVSLFTPGVQLQAVSRTRDSVDVFGLEGAGTEDAGSVDWYGFSTQFAGLTFSGDCSTTTDCYGSLVNP